MELTEQVAADPFRLAGTFIFALAVLHAFWAPTFGRVAHRLQVVYDLRVARGEVAVNAQGESVSFRASLCHLLGEVEAVFGLWSMVLFVTLVAWPGKGWEFACRYIETGDYVPGVATGPSKFIEPLFVFVIMVMASARPIIKLTEGFLGRVARIFGGSPAVCWFVILTLAPLLGSLITEPAAMTISALLLAGQFYVYHLSDRLKYATMGLLFVNISVGGALTHFAAPPVVMVASKWGWGLGDVFAHFGWAAIAAVFISSTIYFVVFRRELLGLKGIARAGRPEEKIPLWVTLAHLGFIIWTVVMLTGHQGVLMTGGLLAFLAFTVATAQWQGPMNLRGPLLVGFFLAGLVLLGGVQGWWIGPMLGRLGEGALMAAATVLTSFNDNAAITYLASQVPALAVAGPGVEALRHAVMAGALAGGGMTVIANAPNPAGQSILSPYFEGGVSPLKLALWALLPTLVALACFIYIR